MFTIDETAPVVVRLSTTIDAPLERVWDLHTDIDDAVRGAGPHDPPRSPGAAPPSAPRSPSSARPCATP